MGGHLDDISTVFDIENALQKLSRNDLTTFRDWFLGFDAAAWDKQFEEDVAAGRLEAIRQLPKEIQELTDANYELLKND